MKVDSSLILKPGAKLEVKKIDFNDPEVIKFIEHSKRMQRDILRYKIINPEKLRQIITI